MNTAHLLLHWEDDNRRSYGEKAGQNNKRRRAMKRCNVLAVWVNDGCEFFLEASDRYRHELIPFSEFGPLEYLLDNFKNALAKLDHRGWVMDPAMIEETEKRFRKLYCQMEKFPDAEEEPPRERQVRPENDWRG
jgi:hypothetical protein